MTNATTTQAPRAIGRDNGIGDIFSADVRYDNGSEGRVVVYGGNLQGAASLLSFYAPIWKFTTLRLQ